MIHRLPGVEKRYTYQTSTGGADFTVIVTEVLGDDGFFGDASPAGYSLTNSGIEIDLSPYAFYDGKLEISIYEGSRLVHEDMVEIVRPYATPGPDDDADEFYEREAVARAIIDAITGGFYYHRRFVSYESNGGDIIPLFDGVNKIIRAWENGVKVFDIDSSFRSTKTFAISPDRTMVLINGGGYVNRRAGTSAWPRLAPSDYLGVSSDTWMERWRPGVFMSGNDYVFDVEMGYRYLPTDITTATKMLIDAGMCTDEYLNRFITSYSTDQYSIKYDKAAMTGTGNRQIDMILSKYVGTRGFIRAGVI